MKSAFEGAESLTFHDDDTILGKRDGVGLLFRPAKQAKEQGIQLLVCSFVLSDDYKVTRIVGQHRTNQHDIIEKRRKAPNIMSGEAHSTTVDEQHALTGIRHFLISSVYLVEYELMKEMWRVYEFRDFTQNKDADKDGLS